jgi:hypothetical protein
MGCYRCSLPAVAACRRCGLLYCGAHGGVTAWGPLCRSCHQRAKRLLPLILVFGIVLLLGFSAFFVYAIFLHP